MYNTCMRKVVVTLFPRIRLRIRTRSLWWALYGVRARLLEDLPMQEPAQQTSGERNESNLKLVANDKCLDKEEPNCSTSQSTCCRRSGEPRLPSVDLPSPTRGARVQKICKRAGLNLHYYCNFYGRAAADSIFHQLESELHTYFSGSPQTVVMAGRTVPIPRRRTAFGDRGLSYTFSGITVQANPWIPLVSSLKDHVEKAIGEIFNFVLVNRYKDGLDHIGEHRDDERELERTAPIVSLSFGQARDFVLRHKDARGWKKGVSSRNSSTEPVKLELGHGSLLVMWPPTNSVWYHSLPIRKRAMRPRINLTFRRMVIPASDHSKPQHQTTA